jgi:hypothetical protein
MININFCHYTHSNIFAPYRESEAPPFFVNFRASSSVLHQANSLFAPNSIPRMADSSLKYPHTRTTSLEVRVFAQVRASERV